MASGMWGLRGFAMAKARPESLLKKLDRVNRAAAVTRATGRRSRPGKGERLTLGQVKDTLEQLQAEFQRTVLPRHLFMKWTEGVLLERDAKGRCLVLDGSRWESIFTAAEKAMDRGETIYLTNEAGVIVSSMALGPNGYEEAEEPHEVHTTRSP